ncbi:MAG: hypothetical protein KME04_05735 [Pleurocapsa minor GSE-CHR-MK-17-07R]|jgi:hypothetical protein|nr:hypothetical protein [Pleurocapsa minor GSE-CHR-MK 17-07R]
MTSLVAWAVATMVSFAVQGFNNPVIVTIFPYEGSITFVSVAQDGSTQIVGELPADYRLWQYQTYSADQRHLESPDSIALSPDGQFAAVSTSRGEDFMLDVFRTNGTLHFSIGTETPVLAEWRPDGSGFAFVTNYAAYNGDADLGVMYLDATARQVRQLIPRSRVTLPYDLVWSSSDELSLIAREESGSALLSVSFDGVVTALLELTWNGGPGTFGSICEREWSPNMQVWYVVVGCIGSPESIVLEELYRVTPDGTAQRVLTAPEAYRAPDVFQARHNIAGVEIAGDEVYVLLQEWMFVPDTEVAPTWHILRMRGESWEEVVSLPSVAGNNDAFSYTHAATSPNGRYMAVGRYRYLVDPTIANALLVVDLMTGDIVRTIDLLAVASFSDALLWFSDDAFLYGVNYYGQGYPMMSNFLLVAAMDAQLSGEIVVPLNDPVWLP